MNEKNMILKKEDFMCGICKSLLVEPTMTDSCQHTFCKACLQGNTSRCCPMCRCSYSKMIPNLFFANIMNDHFGEEIEICPVCGKEHVYRLIAECLKKKVKPIPAGIPKERPRVISTDVDVSPYDIMMDTLRNPATVIGGGTSPNPTGEISLETHRPGISIFDGREQDWWYIFTGRLRPSPHPIRLRNADAQFVFNEQHRVWHLSNEDPAVVASLRDSFFSLPPTDALPAPPPPTDPLTHPISATPSQRPSRVRYVDSLGLGKK